MKLCSISKIEYPWSHGETNASMYVNILLQLTSSSKSNHSNVKQILVSRKQDGSSFVCFLIQKQSSRNKVQSIICTQKAQYMKFLCYDIDSDLVIEIQIYFNIPTLYHGECLTGCANYFHDAKWNIETQSHFNNLGFINF